MQKFEKTIFVTGGCGFIGSHLVRHLCTKYPQYQIVNIDKLTYAGNFENLKDVHTLPNHFFEKVDIRSRDGIERLFQRYAPNGIIHLAAETHVDRSISNPLEFAETNVMGTLNLLQRTKDYFRMPIDKEAFRFYHVSTDEVYGSLTMEDAAFKETTPYDPRSPYSASKAASDHFVRSYYHTFKIPILISNCSNNYGPNQFPEKLLPLVINNVKNNIEIPVYGDGKNVRDWLYVTEHAEAIDKIYHEGKDGETYNIGGNDEWTNIDLVKEVCKIMDKKLKRKKGTSEKLIKFVGDRKGHDFRYAIDCSKIIVELGWEPKTSINGADRPGPKGLEMTIDWYLENEEWLNSVTSGEYQKYYVNQYQGGIDMPDVKQPMTSLGNHFVTFENLRI